MGSVPRDREFRYGVPQHDTVKGVLGSGSALVAALALARPAAAATLYVSPTGTAETGCTTRANPCSLASAAAAAVAGDTVVLMDGLYKEQPLLPAHSGTASAWITFRADDCATPILEGSGVAPDVKLTDDVGVYSKTAEYVRFVGIVSRGWNEGFGNGWADGVDSTAVSNGHWEIDSCISYSNGRTGFTFFSASDFHLKNSISAHNGSSTVASWSSGVTLFEATGTNLVEGTVSFENTDGEKHTDGSGFIVDEGVERRHLRQQPRLRQLGLLPAPHEELGHEVRQQHLLSELAVRLDGHRPHQSRGALLHERRRDDAERDVHEQRHRRDGAGAGGLAADPESADVGLVEQRGDHGHADLLHGADRNQPELRSRFGRHDAHGQGRERKRRAHAPTSASIRSAWSNARRSWSARSRA